MRDGYDSDDKGQEANGVIPRECTPIAIPRGSFPLGVVFLDTYGVH